MITPQAKATIFGRYPIGTKIIIGDNKESFKLLGFKEYSVYTGKNKNDIECYYKISACSLLLTDLKDITEEHAWAVCKILRLDYNEDPESMDYFTLERFRSELDNTLEMEDAYDAIQYLMLLGYAFRQTVIENGQPITLSVADCVQNNVFKIRE